MDIKFENLEKIDLLIEKIDKLEAKLLCEKRWLNTSEAATYLGYSKEHIPKLKNSHLIEGKHYYKKAGRVLYDKYELDNWVTTGIHSKVDVKEIVDNIFKDIL